MFLWRERKGKKKRGVVMGRGLVNWVEGAATGDGAAEDGRLVGTGRSVWRLGGRTAEELKGV